MICFEICSENPLTGFSMIREACNFIKKRLQHRCFRVKYSKFLRTLFFAEKGSVAASVNTVMVISNSSRRDSLSKVFFKKVFFLISWSILRKMSTTESDSIQLAPAVLLR